MKWSVLFKYFHYKASLYNSDSYFFQVSQIFGLEKPADTKVLTSEGPINTFGCACRVDESNTLIDNSEASELVHNNSQWHPGFSALGSVPGMLPTETLASTIQNATQQNPTQVGPSTTPEDPESDIDAVDDEDDEMDEEMDDEDSFDYDAFEEGTLDEGVAAIEGTLDAHIGFQPPAPAILPPNPVSHTPEAPEITSLVSNEDFTLSEDDSDLPDLEEVSVGDQHEQQTTEGNARTPYIFVRIANARVLRGRTRFVYPIFKTRESNSTVLRHHARQNLSQLHRSTL